MPCPENLFSRLKTLVLLIVPLTLTGCLLDEDGGYEVSGSHSNGVPLSQAMHASATGSTEPLHGSGSSPSHSYYNPGPDTAVVAGSGSGAAAGDSIFDTRNFSMVVPLDVAYSIPFGGEFRSFTRFTLTPICLETDRGNFGIFVAGDIVDLKPNTLAASAVENTWMFELGFSGRIYLNPAHAFVSPYFSGNLASQVLFWDYRNPVFINGQEVKSDTLPGLGAYAGFGVAFNRNEPLSFFLETGFGGTVFVDQTGQGFGNDVFHDFGYFSVKGGLCIKF